MNLLKKLGFVILYLGLLIPSHTGAEGISTKSRCEQCDVPEHGDYQFTLDPTWFPVAENEYIDPIPGDPFAFHNHIPSVGDMVWESFPDEYFIGYTISWCHKVLAVQLNPDDPSQYRYQYSSAYYWGSPLYNYYHTERWLTIDGPETCDITSRNQANAGNRNQAGHTVVSPPAMSNEGTQGGCTSCGQSDSPAKFKISTSLGKANLSASAVSGEAWASILYDGDQIGRAHV